MLATAPISSDFDVIAQATAAAAESIGLKATIETITPNAYTALFSDPAHARASTSSTRRGTSPAPTRSRCTACCAPASSATTANGPTPSSTQVVNEAIAIDDPAAALREDRRGAAHRQRASCRGCRSTTRPMTLFLGERITGVAPSIAFLYYPWAATIGAR